MKKTINQTTLLFMCALLAHGALFAQPVNPQPGENIWHLIAAVGTEVDIINTNQTTCCAGTFTALTVIESKLETIQTSSCDLSGTFTVIEAISRQEVTIESKVDLLTESVINDFDTMFSLIAAIPSCDVSGTYTVLNTAIDQELATQSKLDLCCSTLASKVDILILDAFQACAPIQLSQSNVSAGLINLSSQGQAYCLSENITGTITLNAPNITLDLNQHAVIGLILINSTATQAIVRNGNITPLSPANNTSAAMGALLVQASHVQLLNLKVQCATTTVPGVNGLSGIRLENSNALIKETIVIAGASGNAASIPSLPGGNGGVGIDFANQSDNTQIIDCTITAGLGSTAGLGATGGNGGNGINIMGNSVLISGSTITSGAGFNGGQSNAVTLPGSGGAGGIGINTLQLSDNNLTVVQSVIRAGNGGGTPANTATNSGSVSGGNGGVAINNVISFSTFDSCTIRGGNGGVVVPSTGINSGGSNGGNGANAINNFATDSVNIINCNILSGAGNPGGVGTSATLQGSGGASGFGIFNFTPSVVIKNNVISTGNGGIGATGSSTIAGGAGGISGIGVANLGDMTTIAFNKINIGTGANGGAGTDPNAIGGDSGTGIFNNANVVYIQNNDISVQNAGNGGAGLGTANGSAGGNGGPAIETNGRNVGILFNTLKSGNGGNGGNGVAGVSNGGNGGNGGSGILFSDGDTGQARNNSIIGTGIAGGGGTGLTPGSAGTGGDGIYIASKTAHTEVGLNNIQNTGGYAVNDSTTTPSPNASVIYSNIAFAIGNTTPNPYEISANSASTSGLSVALASSTNFLDNVHIP
jgi:hypothetical protein